MHSRSLYNEKYHTSESFKSRLTLIHIAIFCAAVNNKRHQRRQPTSVVSADFLYAVFQNLNKFRPTSGEYSRPTCPSITRRINSPVRLILA